MYEAGSSAAPRHPLASRLRTHSYVVSVAQPEAVAAGHVLDGGGDAVATPFTVDAIGGEEEVVDANDVVTIV